MTDSSNRHTRPGYSLGRPQEDEGPFRMRGISNQFEQPTSDALRQVRERFKERKQLMYGGKKIVSVPSMKEFWAAEYNLRDFLRRLGCSVSSVPAIWKNSLGIFTALLLVKWDSGEKFRVTFEKIFPDRANPVWTNEYLAGDDFPKPDNLGLSRSEENSFESAIRLVSVPILEMSKESKPYGAHTTLPITTRTEIGKGAYGTVYRIQIAEGCFMVENSSGTASPNKADDSFALKEMTEPAKSQRELAFLRQYRRNSRTSKYIMHHLAIIERGKEVSVIYPLATGDLQKLLEGKLTSFQWREDDEEQFCDIVRKSYNLADAVDFLHDHMRDRGDLACRHGDLKPDNFLVFPNEWKISDMGLAKVTQLSTDQSGLGRTTKTITKYGCGAYAAPEMSGPEGTVVGRKTDIWASAAIVMELMIWGFGGSRAWDDFDKRRGKCSQGLFHDNGALSRAVTEELGSWRKEYCGKMSKFFHEDETKASEFLEDLVKALSEAFAILPEKRVDSKGFLESMVRVFRYFDDSEKAKQRTATPVPSNKLEIRSKPSTTAGEALKKKFGEQRRHQIFDPKYFKPNEQICVSDDTEHFIWKWIQLPTPSALCIIAADQRERLRISAIAYEVYYTARCKGYDVVAFLTLNYYDHTATPLQASLDFVHCFIYQLLKDKPDDQLKEHDLERLGMEDSERSDKEKFESAVALLGQIIKTQQKTPALKPIIVIVDDFWRVCTGPALDNAKSQWEILLALLGCGKIDTDPPSVDPNFKVLIRVNGWVSKLQKLGYSGRWVDPSGEHTDLTLRSVLQREFEKLSIIEKE